MVARASVGASAAPLHRQCSVVFACDVDQMTGSASVVSRRSSASRRELTSRRRRAFLTCVRMVWGRARGVRRSGLRRVLPGRGAGSPARVVVGRSLALARGRFGLRSGERSRGSASKDARAPLDCLEAVAELRGGGVEQRQLFFREVLRAACAGRQDSDPALSALEPTHVDGVEASPRPIRLLPGWA